MVSTRMGASTGYLPDGFSPTKVRKVLQKGPSNAKPFALRFKLASSLQSHRRLFLLTFVPAACFPGSWRKAYPKAFWHCGAVTETWCRQPVHCQRFSFTNS